MKMELVAARRKPLPSRLFWFWARRSSGEAVALFRLSLGLLCCIQVLHVALNLERYYGPRGILPYEELKAIHAYWQYSLFALAPASSTLPVLLCGLLGLCAVGLLLGVKARWAALGYFAVWLSFQQRNPLIINSGDWLIGMLAAFSAFMPLGSRAALTGRCQPKLVENWGRRLVQLQICYVYWYAFLAKIPMPRWQQGLALRDVLASPVYSEWPMYINLWAARGLTYGSLLFEIGFPVLVWVTRARNAVLLAGVAFHVGVEIFMRIPTFSAAMLCTYPLFLPDEVAGRILHKLRLSPGRQN